MSEVKVNMPPPAPVTPESYDLMGLTHDQFGIIRSLIGATEGLRVYELYHTMRDTLPEAPYEICHNGKILYGPIELRPAGAVTKKK